MMEPCTESSHINPLLGPGLLLSLPPMSVCLYFLCFCHSLCCYPSFYLSVLCYMRLSLWAYFFTCLSPSNVSSSICSVTLHYRYPTVSLYCLGRFMQGFGTCVTGWHLILREPHWHQQVANVTLARGQVGTTGKGWRWHCRGWLYCMCLCHRRDRRTGRVRETKSVGIRMEQRAFSRTAGIDTAHCLHSQPPWAQWRPKK